METLLVVDHRNEYYGPKRGSSKGFRGINCRTFQSGGPFLTPPLTKQSESRFLSPPLTKKFSFGSLRTPSPPVKSQTAETKNFRRIVKSNTISLPIKIKAGFNKDGFFYDDFSYTELWAGPAYVNSPSPSALPIPKFSICKKRSVTKSAPPSPSREHKGGYSRNAFYSADSATKNLRRILNLDVSD